MAKIYIRNEVHQQLKEVAQAVGLPAAVVVADLLRIYGPPYIARREAAETVLFQGPSQLSKKGEPHGKQG